MPAFRRVDASQAGPTALGVLVPQGQQTIVILRPRILTWDLLPARQQDSGPPVFCSFARDKAVKVARRLLHSLEHAVATGTCPVESFGDAAGTTFQVWARTAEYVWVVCGRQPGRPYQPAVFSSRVEAGAVGDALLPYLWPVAGVEQDYYFNTQLFAS